MEGVTNSAGRVALAQRCVSDGSGRWEELEEESEEEEEEGTRGCDGRVLSFRNGFRVYKNVR